MPHLKYMASKMKVFGILEEQDLVQVAVIALMRARQKFDPRLGFKWSTYALPRARGAMLDALRDIDHLPRLTRSRLKAAGEEGVKVLSVDSQVVEVSHQGIPSLSDTRAERRDFWLVVRRRLGERIGELLERYFIDGLTLAQIGRRMGLSESRTCQLLARGLRELRTAWGHLRLPLQERSHA